jgi:hypothetical protein
MPTGTYDTFTSKVNTEINHQLERLYADKSRPNVAALASSIHCCATSNIEFLNGLNQDYSLHSPDSSFQHIDATYPSLVIEISFSQKRKDLPQLADDYIIGSRGNIKLVIGFDIEYRYNKSATISIWESKEKIEDGVLYHYAEKIVDNKVMS